MTKCPQCGSAGAIVLFRTVECPNTKCKHFSEARLAAFNPPVTEIAPRVYTPSQWYHTATGTRRYYP